MIHRIQSFIKAQRVYLAILVGLCFVYSLLLSRAHSQPANTRESAQYEAFQQAEKDFKEDVGKEGSLETLFQKKPIQTVLFLSYSVLFFVLLIFGSALLLFLLFSKKFRARWLHIYPLEDKPWGLTVLLRVLVHFLTVSLALNLILSAAARLWPGMNTQLAALIHTAVMDAALAVIILFELGFSWATVRSFGFSLKGRSFLGEAWFGLCGYAAVIPFFAVLLFVLVTIAQKLSYEPAPHPLVDVFLSGEKREQGMIAFSIFLACIWGPFFEEVFFRGLCYPFVKRHLGALPGAALSAFLFALVHLNEFAFAPIFLLGLGLALLYEKRGNLVAPITLHIFHNSLFIGYFFTAKSIISQG